MRRRLLWIGGAVVGLALLVVGLAVLFGSPDESFEFLRGRKPIDRWLTRVYGSPMLERTGYTFEGDADVVAERARRELLAKGFEEKMNVHGDEVAAFGRGNWRTPGGRDAQMVWIVGDMRWAVSGHELKADGWVIVYVDGDTPPTLFDRIRSWVGL